MSDVLSVKAFPQQSSTMKVSSRAGWCGLADEGVHVKGTLCSDWLPVRLWLYDSSYMVTQEGNTLPSFYI